MEARNKLVGNEHKVIESVKEELEKVKRELRELLERINNEEKETR